MAAVHCPVCPHVQLPLPPAAGLVPGLLRDNFCFWSGRLLTPAEHREPRGGCAQAHTEGQKQTQVCCSRAGHSRLFYSLLAGLAQQFLLSLLNAEAMQPLASAMAVPPPRCRLSQLADGTVPTHACLVEPGSFSENNPLLGLPEIAAQKTQYRNPQG